MAIRPVGMFRLLTRSATAKDEAVVPGWEEQREWAPRAGIVDDAAVERYLATMGALEHRTQGERDLQLALRGLVVLEDPLLWGAYTEGRPKTQSPRADAERFFRGALLHLGRAYLACEFSGCTELDEYVAMLPRVP